MLESNKWYETKDHRLTADEICGRIVVTEMVVFTPKNWTPEQITNAMCGQSYILIDPKEEEPMELDGAKGTIYDHENYGEVVYRVRYQCGDDRGQGMHLYFYGSTRAEAIHNANEFIRRLK